MIGRSTAARHDGRDFDLLHGRALCFFLLAFRLSNKHFVEYERMVDVCLMAKTFTRRYSSLYAAMNCYCDRLDKIRCEQRMGRIYSPSQAIYKFSIEISHFLSE